MEIDNMAFNLINPLKHHMLMSQMEDLTNGYNLGPRLGEGAFGVVFKGTRKEDDKQVAIKFVKSNHILNWAYTDPTDPSAREALEVTLMRELKEVPGVINLVDTRTCQQGIFIIMDRPPLSLDLYDVVDKFGPLEEPVAAHVFGQVARAVHDMWVHYGVCHNDLKEENILLSLHNYKAYILDFGCATRATGEPQDEFIGTHGYIPPEFRIPAQRVPERAAVWSMGIILYSITHWNSPLNEYDEVRFPLSFRYTVSAGCRDLITSCLQEDPERRITLPRILQHPWLKGNVGESGGQASQPPPSPPPPPSQPPGGKAGGYQTWIPVPTQKNKNGKRRHRRK